MQHEKQFFALEPDWRIGFSFHTFETRHLPCIEANINLIGPLLATSAKLCSLAF